MDIDLYYNEDDSYEFLLTHELDELEHNLSWQMYLERNPSLSREEIYA